MRGIFILRPAMKSLQQFGGYTTLEMQPTANGSATSAPTLQASTPRKPCVTKRVSVKKWKWPIALNGFVATTSRAVERCLTGSAFAIMKMGGCTTMPRRAVSPTPV